jgi:hypothetical protein
VESAEFVKLIIRCGDRKRALHKIKLALHNQIGTSHRLGPHRGLQWEDKFNERALPIRQSYLRKKDPCKGPLPGANPIMP